MLKERLVKLLDVKSIITLALILTACWGFFDGKVSIELFSGWVAMVITYFFAKRKEGE